MGFPVYTKKCVICGKTFTTTVWKATACSSECSKEKEKRRRAEKKIDDRKKPSALSITARRARTCGMSYGEYVRFVEEAENEATKETDQKSKGVNGRQWSCTGQLAGDIRIQDGHGDYQQTQEHEKGAAEAAKMHETSVKLCKTCVYGVTFVEGYNACDYMGKTGQRRGCPLGLCNKYKKRGGRRKWRD